MTVVAMIVGALAALVVAGLGGGVELALLAAVTGFLIGTATFAVVGMRAALSYQGRIEPRFPSPD